VEGGALILLFLHLPEKCLTNPRDQTVFLRLAENQIQDSDQLISERAIIKFKVDFQLENPSLIFTKSFRFYSSSEGQNKN
jgi:hypothetical protein